MYEILPPSLCDVSSYVDVTEDIKKLAEKRWKEKGITPQEFKPVEKIVPKQKMGNSKLIKFLAEKTKKMPKTSDIMANFAKNTAKGLEVMFSSFPIKSMKL